LGRDETETESLNRLDRSKLKGFSKLAVFYLTQMSDAKYSTRMRSERHFDLNEKVKRIAFVQVKYERVLKTYLTNTFWQIFCSFNATRLNSVIAAGDIMQRYLYYL
jgi:hypothetical protein